jgi:hypothetical protein
MPVPTGKCHNIQSIVAEESAKMLKKPKMLVRFSADFVMPAPESKRDLRHTLYPEDQESAIQRTLQFASRQYAQGSVGLAQHGFLPPVPGGHQDQNERERQ